MARYRLAPRAFADFAQIVDRIADDNPTAADELADRFEQAFATLAKFPLSGEARPEFGDEIRTSIVDAYVIYYRPSSEGIAVARIIHGARDVKRL